jgi:hypothetical protein
VAEFGRESIPKPKQERKGRSTWSKAVLTFEMPDDTCRRGRDLLADQPVYLAESEMVGQERELMYKIMVRTGLRKGELASLTRAVGARRPAPLC